MTIEFRCAQCNQLLRVPDTSAGKNARCPKCQTLMQIPSAGPAYVPPPPPPNFVPPPPPPPGNFAPSPPRARLPGQPASPFDFSGGSSTGGSPSQSGAGKKQAFDFLGGAPPPPQNAPPPPPPPGSGGFMVNTSGPVNPYASPSGSAIGRASSPTTKGGRQGLPWEKKPHKKGMFAAFMDTAKLVCFEPGKAFSQMHQQGDMGGPMLYSGLGMALGILAMAVWTILILFAMTASLNGRPEAYGILFVIVMFYAGIYLVIGVPMGATLGNLLGGGVLHICLLICGGSKFPFDTSFRIQCYVSGSLMLAMVFPPAAVFMGIWQIICTIIAVHKAHEVPMGRAAMAVLLPLIVVMVLAAVMMFLLFASMAAALSQMK